ncbi:MAG: sulfatase-like hydrolase/transferase, partial [Planctomycetales bacterium]
ADTPVVRENFSNYLAEITYYDGQVGQILDLLDKHKLRENTLVMVVSEQGSSFPFAKWTCYANGLQSAMVVRWPGKVKPDSVSDAMVEYVDVAPTFVAAAGGTPAKVLDGRSILPVLTGETDRHKDHVYGIMTTRGIINGSSSYPIRTVRDQRYRLIWNLSHETKFTNACTKSSYFQSMVAAAENGDAKAKELVHKYHHRPEYELFDCNSDPLEMTNLAGDSKLAEIQSRLKQKLSAWMKEQGDLGVQTEIEAVLHQGRYRGMTREEALKAWESKKSGGKKKPGGKKKANKKKSDKKKSSK